MGKTTTRNLTLIYLWQHGSWQLVRVANEDQFATSILQWYKAVDFCTLRSLKAAKAGITTRLWYRRNRSAIKSLEIQTSSIMMHVKCAGFFGFFPKVSRRTFQPLPLKVQQTTSTDLSTSCLAACSLMCSSPWWKCNRLPYCLSGSWMVLSTVYLGHGWPGGLTACLGHR